MKYKIYLPNFGSYRNAKTRAKLAHDAEEAGWDGMFPPFQVRDPNEAWFILSRVIFTI